VKNVIIYFRKCGNVKHYRKHVPVRTEHLKMPRIVQTDRQTDRQTGYGNSETIQRSARVETGLSLIGGEQ
jgi:ribosomal protein L44E